MNNDSKKKAFLDTHKTRGKYFFFFLISGKKLDKMN